MEAEEGNPSGGFAQVGREWSDSSRAARCRAGKDPFWMGGQDRAGSALRARKGAVVVVT